MPFPWVTLRFCFKTSPEVVWKLSVENEFDLHKNEPSLGGHVFIWTMSHNLSFGSFTANAFYYIVNCLSIASAFSVNTYGDHSSQNDFLMLLTLGWRKKKHLSWLKVGFDGKEVSLIGLLLWRRPGYVATMESWSDYTQKSFELSRKSGNMQSP